MGAGFNQTAQSGTCIVSIFQLADIGKLHSKCLEQIRVVMEGMSNTTLLNNWILTAIEDMQAHQKGSVLLLIFNEYVGEVLKQAKVTRIVGR